MKLLSTYCVKPSGRYSLARHVAAVVGVGAGLAALDGDARFASAPGMSVGRSK